MKTEGKNKKKLALKKELADKIIGRVGRKDNSYEKDLALLMSWSVAELQKKLDMKEGDYW